MKPMIIHPSRKQLFISGLLLVIASNLFVLTGVFLNKAGKPLSEIRLTEREINKRWSRVRENNALSLQLDWRLESPENNYNSRWGSPSWLDKKKMALLGFDIKSYENLDWADGRKKRKIAKKVFLVLENNGKAYEATLKAAEKNLEEVRASNAEPQKIKDAEARFMREKNSYSRLFVIDAGIDYQTLYTMYSESGNCFIVPGIIKPRVNYIDKKYEIAGYVKSLCVTQIHVPLDKKKKYIDITGNRSFNEYKSEPPRYSVDIAYGRRHEPWIKGIHPLPQ